MLEKSTKTGQIFLLGRKINICSLAFIFCNIFEASRGKEPWTVMAPKKDLKIRSLSILCQKIKNMSQNFNF